MTIVRAQCSSEDTGEQARLPSLSQCHQFTPFSADVAIFINLQLFFSCNSIDNIYLCQSCDESTIYSWALQKFDVSIYEIPPCLKFPLDIRDESCPTRLTTLSARMALMSREGGRSSNRRRGVKGFQPSAEGTCEV